MMIGVASAQGVQVISRVTKSFAQAWCMPSARMVITVWVASHSPRANQTETIQIQLREGRRATFTDRIVFYFSLRGSRMQRIDGSLQSPVWLWYRSGSILWQVLWSKLDRI